MDCDDFEPSARAAAGRQLCGGLIGCTTSLQPHSSSESIPMADKYDFCPCGSGKKVKFCCKEVAPDIEKVRQLLESEQRAAALQHLNLAIEKHGQKPALMDLKISALIEMQQFPEAEEVVLNLLQANPDSARPHALAAIMDVLKGNVDDAVKQLQRALQHLEDDNNPMPVFDALAMVSSALYEVGDPYVTRAHLMQWLKWADEQASQQPLRMLLELDTEIHPLLLVDLDDYEPPADAPWRDAYFGAQRLADRGAWVAAADTLNVISRDAPDTPRLRQEFAYLIGKAGAREEMISALRDFAKLDNVDYNDAVEAEAVAQLLDVGMGAVDVVQFEYAIEDADAVTEKLLSTDQCFSVDPSRVPREEGAPPPRGMFIALSKELPGEGAEPTFENTPITLGQISVFGRQTDREARVEIVGAEDGDLDNVKTIFTEATGQSLGEGKDRKVVGGRNRLNALISPQLFFAPGVTPAQQFQIQTDMLKETVLKTWAETGNPHLNGKSPIEAADDDSLKVKRSAALVLVEQSLFLSQRRLDTSSLRERLGMPAIEWPESIDVDQVHRIEYSHLDVSKLDDEGLIKVIRAGMVRARRLLAIEAIEEAINRKLYEKEEELSLDALYDLLARWHSSPAEQLSVIERAKADAQPGSESLGGWLLRELVIRIESGQGPEAKHLIDTLTQGYQHSQSVMQGLMQVLSRYGLLQSPMGGPPQQQEGFGSPSDVAVAMAREQQAAEGGGLWTPDGPPEASDDDDKPSGLWLPD